MAADPKVMLHPKHAVRLRTVTESIHNNVAGSIRWCDLVVAMRDAGVIACTEEVEAFVLLDDGIQFFVARR